jgi:arylsulfatase A-like enzyme
MPMNHFFRLALSAVLLALFAASGLPAAPPSRPNVIWIMADDLGYGDLGCYGQKVVKTPEIDRLAAEGMQFTSFYAGCTVCRPSRLVLWTGKHTGHTPISSNARYVFRPDDVTVAELLHEAGYATGGIAKWAMGQPDTSGIPTRNGFDFWMGYLDQSEAHNYYPTHLWRCRGQKTERVPLKGNRLMGDSGPKSRVAQLDHRQTYSHTVMTDEALEFIRREKERPFLLHVHWTLPHANNEGGRVTGNGMEVPDYGPYADRDWPDTEKGFAAMVTLMDRDVGRIVKLLRDLELDKKTLIFFTSDNGPHQEGGHKHEFFDSNGPLRGFKRDLYEGGIRVPGIAWWPGVVPAGSVSDEPLAFYDFLVTACRLTGVVPPEKTDGISFVPALRGQLAAQQHHDHLYWKYGSKEAVRRGKWKAVRLGPKKPLKLYDLATDIGEKNDVGAAHPEVVERMKEILKTATAGPT